VTTHLHDELERDEGWRDEPSLGADLARAALEITRLRGVLRGVQRECDIHGRTYCQLSSAWKARAMQAKDSRRDYESGYWEASSNDATRTEALVNGLAATIAAALAKGTDDDA
jgi:hypothetical protein